MIGKKTWLIADGFLPQHSTGKQMSHEAVCVLNITAQDAIIHLSFYFEDREPMEDFTVSCASKRTHHIRLDKIADKEGRILPKGVPYAIKIDSSVPVTVQHSRLDTSQTALALFTTMAYAVD